MEAVETRRLTEISARETSDRARSGELARRIAIYLPLLIGAGVSIWISVWSISFRLTMQYPQNPWESAIIVDAARAAKGMQVYMDPNPTGHVTHLYGPLATYLLSVVFRFVEPNFYSGRLISLISASILTILFLKMFVPRRNFLLGIIAIGLMVALHYRCRAYFTETRPDTTGLLIATISLIFAYRAAASESWIWYALAGATAFLAFMFKQTYMLAAAVPLLAIWLQHGRPTRRQIALALIPVAVVALSMLVFRITWRWAYYYTIEVPSQMDVPRERLFYGLVNLIYLSPLFIAMLCFRGPNRALWRTREPRLSWVLAATLIGSAMGIVAFAKRGGSFNSLMLGFAPMTALCLLLAPGVLRWLGNDWVQFSTRLTASVIGGLLIIATTFAVPSSDRWGFAEAHGSEGWDHTTRIARRLRGTVICPDDPTIMLKAKGRFESSLDAELDMRGRPSRTPETLVRRFSRADYIIRVHSGFDNLNSDELMKHLGFERASTPRLKRGYTLWKKVGRPAASTSQPAPQVRRPTRPQRP